VRFWISLAAVAYLLSAAIAQATPTRTTWSIFLHDQAGGRLIAATVSKYPNVVQRVCRAQAGVGLVISKARGEPMYFDALKKLASGQTARQALAELLSEDEVNGQSMKSQRQVLLASASGEIAVHTGSNCGSYAGALVKPGKQYAVLGNGLLNEAVLKQIAVALEREHPWERLVAGLEAGMEAGGEVRPENSAGICYTTLEKVDSLNEGQAELLSVYDSATPVKDLTRLVRLERARLALERAFSAYEHGDVQNGERWFLRAALLNPSDYETQLWRAFFLFKSGNREQAIKVLGKYLPKTQPWGGVMLRRFGGETGKELLAALEKQLVIAE